MGTAGVAGEADGADGLACLDALPVLEEPLVHVGEKKDRPVLDDAKHPSGASAVVQHHRAFARALYP